MQKNAFLFLLSILLCSFGALAQSPSKAEKKISARVHGHIAILASDAFAGRGAGSEGEQRSASYIAKAFEEIGLQTKGEDGYFQHLEITTLRMAQDATSLKIDSTVYDLFKAFYPLSSSADGGQFTGSLVQVHHGISDSELGRDDYAGLDVAGKAVAINMYTPDSTNPHSQFASWNGVERRAELAKSKGAKAVLFYGSVKDDFPSGELKKMNPGIGIPVLFVKRDLGQLIQSQVELDVQILRLNTQASNVIGYLDHGAEHTVVIGAHHDHLGHGEFGGSRAEKTGEIHNGADDNASGVAGLIELARIIKEHPKDFKHNNYLFIAFTAEEMGLIGSKYYVAHPTVPLAKTNYMINMDMIGKLDSTQKTLVINGVGTSPTWKLALEEVKRDERKIAAIKTTESGIGSSDHTPFYLGEIPSVHFFTGQHTHYHKPSDDLEIINFDGEAYVLTYICRWLEFMDEQGKIPYTKTKDESQGRMKFKVTLGIVPDYIYDGEGLRIDGVRENKPAALAGLQKGDILTGLNGKPIMSIQDYMQLLMELEPGDKVPAQVKRGEEFIEVTIQF